jgi:hypothetical protein
MRFGADSWRLTTVFSSRRASRRIPGDEASRNLSDYFAGDTDRPISKARLKHETGLSSHCTVIVPTIDG